MGHREDKGIGKGTTDGILKFGRQGKYIVPGEDEHHDGNGAENIVDDGILHQARQKDIEVYQDHGGGDQQNQKDDR